MTYNDYYEPYMNNGYLEDLLPYLEHSQYKDDIIWNVLDVYSINGGLYVLSPQFRLEGLLIHPEYEVSVEEWNMGTFLGLIEENDWKKDIFGGQIGNPEDLLYYMLHGRQEEFIDWENKTAAFETEEFMNMLTLCRECARSAFYFAGDKSVQEVAHIIKQSTDYSARVEKIILRNREAEQVNPCFFVEFCRIL